MILVPNALFVVAFAVLAVAAVLMLRRGVAAEAACAAASAVGCVLPLAAVALAPAARDGNMIAAALATAAYILAYVLTFGGAAGVWVFARQRAAAPMGRVDGVRDGGAL